MHKHTGFSLTEDHIKVIDGWCDSTGLNRSHAVRLAIQELADRKIVKDGFNFVFTPRSTEIEPNEE